MEAQRNETTFARLFRSVTKQMTELRPSDLQVISLPTRLHHIQLQENLQISYHIIMCTLQDFLVFHSYST